MDSNRQEVPVEEIPPLSQGEAIREDLKLIEVTVITSLYWLAPGSEGWDRLAREESLSFDDWEAILWRVVSVWRYCPGLRTVRERTLTLVARAFLEADRAAPIQAMRFVRALEELLWCVHLRPGLRYSGLSHRELSAWLGEDGYNEAYERLVALRQKLEPSPAPVSP